MTNLYRIALRIEGYRAAYWNKGQWSFDHYSEYSTTTEAASVVKEYALAGIGFDVFIDTFSYCPGHLVQSMRDVGLGECTECAFTHHKEDGPTPSKHEPDTAQEDDNPRPGYLTHDLS